MRIIFQSIYPYVFLFYCFALPLDKFATSVPNIVLISLAVMFPFVVSKADFQKLLNKETLIYTAMVLLILFGSLFHDYEHDFNIIKKMLVPITLLILYLPLRNVGNLKKTVVISVLACILISLYNLYFFYLENGSFDFAFGSYIDDILVADRLYIGFLCVTSVVCSISLMGNKYSEYNKWYFANIVLCILFVLLISSRSAILLLLALFLIRIFYAKNKKPYVFFFLGVSLITIVAFAVNENLRDRFFYSYSTMNELSYWEQVQDKEPRMYIWGCSWEIAKKEEYMLTGLGFYTTKDRLVECFEEVVTPERKRNYFVNSRFNPHNQFIDLLLSTGLLPTLLFIALFVLLFKRHRKDYGAMAFLMTLFLFCSIESLFQRQLGASYFGLYMIFLLRPYLDKALTKDTEPQEQPQQQEN